SGACTPATTRISVDLPAPFSPTSPWISPARQSKSTPASACTPGKLLTIPSTARRGAAAVVVLSVMLERVRGERRNSNPPPPVGGDRGGVLRASARTRIPPREQSRRDGPPPILPHKGGGVSTRRDRQRRRQLKICFSSASLRSVSTKTPSGMSGFTYLV